MTRPALPFVVGCGRSGTTLLAAMLDSHPDLAVPAEAGGLVLQFCHGLPVGARPDRLEWPEVDPPGDPYDEAALRSLVDELSGCWRYRAWGLDPEAVVGTARSTGAASRVDVVRAAYAAYAEAQGKTRSGDKTPAHGLHMGRLAELLPEAVFVHAIRDGRDVALSIMDMSWGPDDGAGAALHWADRVTRIRTAGRSLGPSRYLEVRYEDLLDDPQGVLMGICAHAGLSYDPAMLDHTAAAGRQLAMSGAPDEDRNLARPLTPGLRDWRAQMDPADIAAFDAVAGPLLAELGYPDEAVHDHRAASAGRRRAELALATSAGRPAEAW
ncbi:MAG TPA: sulfotransferase [Acidimicrobiales bacterium]|nr:sulfotransferase [Acidimicrobiales bacterium]